MPPYDETLNDFLLGVNFKTKILVLPESSRITEIVLLYIYWILTCAPPTSLWTTCEQNAILQDNIYIYFFDLGL